MTRACETGSTTEGCPQRQWMPSRYRTLSAAKQWRFVAKYIPHRLRRQRVSLNTDLRATAGEFNWRLSSMAFDKHFRKRLELFQMI